MVRRSNAHFTLPRNESTVMQIGKQRERKLARETEKKNTVKRQKRNRRERRKIDAG